MGSHTFMVLVISLIVCCHVPVPPRTARVPVLREADFTSSVVQERSGLQSMLNRCNFSSAQSGFLVLGGFFLVAGIISGPSTSVNCMKNKTYRNIYI